jgi:asparagine synthase (glutamine-hydrolysing)
VEGDAIVALLEGAVYSHPAAAIASQLSGLALAFATDDVAARATAERWAAQLDGDFVIVLAARDGSRALVINDRLGRLPLYWAAQGGGAAIAREVKAVRAVTGAGEVDRIALGQMLLFSFPLGTRTLHAHIKRLGEASSALVRADGTIDVSPYVVWNFEELHAAGGFAGAPDLADRFAAACAAQTAWAGTRAIVLGLSGGLDSRAVAAALTRAKAHYDTVTFVTGRKKAAEETQTSEAIARALGAGWDVLRLDAPSWEDERRMAQLRDGTSNVALAFMFDYFRIVAQRFGADAYHFTGDGGDRALPDLRADVSVSNPRQFLDYRLATALWPPAEAAALVGLPERTLVDAVRDHFASYPERDARFHNVRFMIADWAMCRLFCGEDRNRSFLWGAAPFYSQSFFDAAMRAPLRAKRHYRLYADFLRALDPRVLRIAKSNWGYAVDSPRVTWNGWREGAAAALQIAFKRRFAGRADGVPRGRYGTEEHDPGFAALARAHDGRAFDPARLRAVSERGLDKLQYHMLATALAYVDHAWTGSAPEHASVPNGRGPNAL